MYTVTPSSPASRTSPMLSPDSSDRRHMALKPTSSSARSRKPRGLVVSQVSIMARSASTSIGGRFACAAAFVGPFAFVLGEQLKGLACVWLARVARVTMDGSDCDDHLFDCGRGEGVPDGPDDVLVVGVGRRRDR